MDQAGSVKHSTPSERPTMAVRSRHFHDQSVASISFFFFQAEDGIRDVAVTVQTCALPISFTPGAAGPGPGGYSAQITWGDGQTSTGTVVANPQGGLRVTGSHTFAEEGSDVLTVVVTEDRKSVV